jgi:hypothetical protein
VDENEWGGGVMAKRDELTRRTIELRRVWTRLMAAALVDKRSHRYTELVDEARAIANKECARVYAIERRTR